MNKKKTLGAVIGMSLVALMLTTNTPKAAAAISAPSIDGTKTYVLSNSAPTMSLATTLSSYDVNGSELATVTLCKGAMACTKFYTNGTMYSQIQVEDDAVYVIGQVTTRAQSRNMQENFATVVIKYDLNLNQIWKKTYRVESSNSPQSSKIANDILYVTVKAGTNVKMGAYGQRINSYSTYELAIDDLGAMTATKQ